MIGSNAFRLGESKAKFEGLVDWEADALVGWEADVLVGWEADALFGWEAAQPKL